MIGAIKTALSGLMAQGTKLATTSSNIANAFTAGSVEDEANAPYAAKNTQFSSVNDGKGVAATVVNKDPAFVPSYDPDSPFANEEGIIGAPNVSLDQEVVALKEAELAYKANLKTIETASEMQDELLDSFDKDV